MTKEKCIALLNCYAEYNGIDIPNPAECREAMRMAAELLSHPSLPSNLDEAAEKAGLEYAPEEEGEAVDSSGQVYDTDDVNWPLRCGFLTGFKAGAAWMAGQGETKEAVIGMATYEIFIKVSEQTLDELDLRPGDKVVVQIRKKQ